MSSAIEKMGHKRWLSRMSPSVASWCIPLLTYFLGIGAALGSGTFIQEILDLPDGAEIPPSIYAKYDTRDIGRSIVERLRRRGSRHPVRGKGVNPFETRDFELRIYRGGSRRDPLTYLLDGIVNFHQTGTSGGQPSHRASRENEIAGVALEKVQGLDPSIHYTRPKYGNVFFFDGSPTSMGGQSTHYGPIGIVLKDEVASRTTWAAEDTLNARGLLPDPIPINGKWRGAPYEIQVFGQIEVTDIKHFLVPAKVPRSHITSLKKSGLPIFQYTDIEDAKTYRKKVDFDSTRFKAFSTEVAATRKLQMQRLRRIGENLRFLLKNANRPRRHSRVVQLVAKNIERFLRQDELAKPTIRSLGALIKEDPKIFADLLIHPSSRRLRESPALIPLVHSTLARDVPSGRRILANLGDPTSRAWSKYLTNLATLGDQFDVVSNLVMNCVRSSLNCQVDPVLFRTVVASTVDPKTLQHPNVAARISRDRQTAQNLRLPSSERTVRRLMQKWDLLNSNNDFREYDLFRPLYDDTPDFNRATDVTAVLSREIEGFVKEPAHLGLLLSHLDRYTVGQDYRLRQTGFFTHLEIPTVMREARTLEIISKFADSEKFDWGYIVTKWGDLNNPAWVKKLDTLIDQENSIQKIMEFVARNIDHPKATGMIDRIIAGHSAEHVYWQLDEVLASPKYLASHPRRQLWEKALALRDKSARRTLLGLPDPRTSGPKGKLKFLKKEVSGFSGSGWYTDEAEVKWLLKADNIHAELQTSAEVISSGIYRKLGYIAPETHIVTHEGKRYAAVREIEDILRPSLALSRVDSQSFRQARFVAAYLDDWDRTGRRGQVNNFNLRNGGFAFFDFGGTLGSRSRGRHKPGAIVSDAVGAFDLNATAEDIVGGYNRLDHLKSSHAWNRVTVEDADDLARKFKADLTDDFLKELVDSAHYSKASDSDYMFRALKARRDAIIGGLPAYARQHFPGSGGSCLGDIHRRRIR